MRTKLRAALGGFCALLAVTASLPLALPVNAAADLTIGVDNVTPTGHNFMYTDFFPRSGVSALGTATIDFAWNTGSPDGFHTVTLLKSGETPAQAWAANPFVVADADDSASQLQANPAVGAPTNPACGTSGSPCTYDGSADLNSGAFPTVSGNEFFVTLNVTAPATISYVCLIHPGMTGTIDVVASGASSQAALNTAATTQYNSDTTAALAAESAVTNAAATTNANGTKTWNVTAGVNTANVQVIEMLPQSISIHAGDSIKWTNKSTDIHTVTFPAGSGSDSVDPLPFVCEAGPPDTPATGPPPAFGCGNPTLVENHVNPAPVGGTSIASASTVATSGLLSTAPLPFPTNFSFTFPNAGTFAYQCRIHDHMTGQVSAAAITLPKAGARPAQAAPAVRSPLPLPILLGAVIALVALSGAAGLAVARPRG